jgi:hypothetical protein
MNTYVHLCQYLAQFFSEWNTFQTNAVEKIKTHILCPIIFFFRKWCRLWDNVVKYYKAGQDIDENKIWRMGFAYWITKATDTHSEYVVLIAFPRQQRSSERASARLYVHFMHSVNKSNY